MRQITMEMVKDLRKEFDSYCDNAEQPDFALLFLVDLPFQKTITDLEKDFNSHSQEELNSMFRCILRVIGKDFSKYV